MLAAAQGLFIQIPRIEEQVKRSVDFALSEFGGLHGAFNNAGIMSKGASLVEMRLADCRSRWT